MASDIVWFRDLRISDVGRAGGKGANLGELTDAGLPVPEGFVITAGAYLAAIDEAGVRAELRDAAASADPDDPDALAAVAQHLRELVTKAGMPETLRRE